MHVWQGSLTVRQLLHSSGILFCVATVRCGKTLVIHDNRVQRRYIKILFVCLFVARNIKLTILDLNIDS